MATQQPGPEDESPLADAGPTGSDDEPTRSGVIAGTVAAQAGLMGAGWVAFLAVASGSGDTGLGWSPVIYPFIALPMLACSLGALLFVTMLGKDAAPVRMWRYTAMAALVPGAAMLAASLPESGALLGIPAAALPLGLGIVLLLVVRVRGWAARWPFVAILLLGIAHATWSVVDLVLWVQREAGTV